VVAFSIEPAFWQTWTFRGICLVVLSLTIVGIYRLRIYQLTHRLNVRFQDRLAERTRIAQELHDTLLQGVLSASLQLDLAEDQLAADSPAKPLVGRVLELMRRVTEEGRNALHGLRKPEGDRTSLEMAFSRMRQEFALDNKISYRVLVSGPVRPIRAAIRDEVYRIGREAIVNTFLHAQAENIEVEIEYASRHFRMLVRDDGRGIDPEVAQMGREGHWGLTGMRSRSEGIGATLKLRSRSGAGTEVELIVPDKIAFENEASTQRWRWLVGFHRASFRPRAKRKEAESERLR
jgi:signal transduction histidine kinase